MTVISAVLPFVLLLLTVRAQLDADAGQSLVEDRRPLMRAHMQRNVSSSAMMQLSPSGDLVEVHAHAHRGAQMANPVAAVHRQCHYSYLLGTEDTNNCKVVSDHENIFDIEACKFAAEKAGACKGPCNQPLCNKSMDIGLDCNGQERIDATGTDGRYNTHPVGCFKSKTANEFYFNPWSASDHPEVNGGTPVCQRDRFAFGTPGEDDGCPGTNAVKYEKVLEIEECRTAAKCEGYNLNEGEFLVGVPPGQPNDDKRPVWMQEYDGKPRGCFYKEDDDYAYFNKPRTAAPNNIDTNSFGTKPVCSIQRWED